VLLVGRVTELSERLGWYEHLPLFGRRLAIFRPEAQAEDLAAPLTALGARVVRFPVIRLEESGGRDLTRALQRLDRFHWVLFSSPNGVRSFFRALDGAGFDARALGGKKIGVVGPGTADELRQHGLRADHVPGRSVAERFAAELAERGDVAGTRVLLPQARDARPVLAERLAAAGAEVTAVEAYRMVPAGAEGGAGLLAQIREGAVDGLLFTSSSTVTNLLAALGLDDAATLPADCRLISIGPITTDTIRRAGGEVAAEADPHTMPGLVACAARLFGGEG
jgi:uroporphyrinogen III methyltransferase/synthase